MLTPEQAAAVAGVTVRAVNRRVEDGSVHFLETADGRLLLCADSVSQREGFEGLKKLICAPNPNADARTGKQ